jgi:hypothetical protein
VRGKHRLEHSMGKVRHGRVQHLGMANLNNYSEFWAKGVVSVFSTWPWDD